MVKLSPKGLMAVAGVVSLLSAVLIYISLQDDAVPAAGFAEKAVVATRDIDGRVKITADMVKTVEFPRDFIQTGALRDVNAAIGKVTKLPILAGEQVNEKRLALEASEAGMPGAIPKDRRAVTIGVNDITGVAGFVRAGDYVDVIAAMPAGSGGNIASRVILQDAQVLAVGKSDKVSSDKETGQVAYQSATLAVTLEEAERLRLFADSSMLSLALRPFNVKGRQFALGRDLVDVMGRGILKERESVPAPPAPQAARSAPAAAPQAAAPSFSGGGITVYRGTNKEFVPINR